MKSFSLAFAVLLLATGSLTAQQADALDFFERSVRPVLAEKCQVCHNPNLKTADLDLSSAAGFVHGGASGPLVSKDEPEKSKLLEVIGYEERLKMPPTGKLSDEEIANITAWVKAGAPWPGAEQVEVVKRADSSKGFSEEEKNYWAFQPVKDPAPPKVSDESWVRSPIDRFILAKLDEKRSAPAPAADKLTLLRRVTFDLTGLPPTVKEIEAFLADDSPQAFERVVERLLASPRYGEHWGRHWLDVARYADSTGNDEDHRYPYAWRYRDYVIDAFNSDLPYDQFVREQIAGDLLPPENPADALNRRGIVATGFLALGPKALAQQDKKKMLYDIYDEQVDVLSKAFLGVTVACARCHDHKFDPIRTKDYYSMVSIFASTQNFEDPSTHVSKMFYTPLVPVQLYEDFKSHRVKVIYKHLDVDEALAGYLETHALDSNTRLADYMVAAGELAGNGGDLAALASERNLDAAVLKKWVDYLKPAAGEREHLAEWRGAQPGQLRQVAAGYQERAQKQLDDWIASQEERRKNVRKSAKDRVMPVKPRTFSRETDAFVFEVFYDEGGPFAVGENEEEAALPPEGLAKIRALRAELKALEDSAPPEPEMACAVREGERVEQAVFIRGDYNSPGEPAPKAFPAIVAGEDQPRIEKGSGRLELANWIASPDNPLTARVMVNRIWQGHFGEGIVRTPSNFGKMGERPTHPELLDYLAARFVESGWSVKAMHRLILRSAAYQMSSESTDRKAEQDPENLLLSRFSRRRLAVEEIRDGLLAIGGSIDLEMGGTMQSGFGTDGENSNDRLSIDPTSVTRRMVYLPLRRSNLPTLLNLFDFGDATIPTDKRPLTNVAPQALFMMNSDFVAGSARSVAQSLLDEAELSDSARIERAYLRTLNRRPDAEEVDTGLSYLAGIRNRFDSITNIDAWQSLCRILIASNEFVYVD
jgi:cytochrome c553